MTSFTGSQYVRPAILIELRFGGAREVEGGVRPSQPQQEPALLLADAHRLLIAPDVARREAVAQPAVRLPEQRHVRLGDADLLFELAVQCLFERLSAAHTALGKLPAAPTGAATEKHLVAVHQDDAHVGPKTIGVDEVAHLATVCHKAPPR